MSLCTRHDATQVKRAPSSAGRVLRHHAHRVRRVERAHSPRARGAHPPGGAGDGGGGGNGDGGTEQLPARRGLRQEEHPARAGRDKQARLLSWGVARAVCAARCGRKPACLERLATRFGTVAHAGCPKMCHRERTRRAPAIGAVRARGANRELRAGATVVAIAVRGEEAAVDARPAPGRARWRWRGRRRWRWRGHVDGARKQWRRMRWWWAGAVGARAGEAWATVGAVLARHAAVAGESSARPHHRTAVDGSRSAAPAAYQIEYSAPEPPSSPAHRTRSARVLHMRVACARVVREWTHNRRPTRMRTY